jgi:endonuclease YncB( thermonuclease family)
MTMRLLALLSIATTLGTAPGIGTRVARAAGPGGAPPPGSGPVVVSGFVRVIEGDTVEIRIRGRQVGVGFLGIQAPMGNTPCGRLASARLASLVATGLRLEEDEDLALAFDERGRRMYHAVVPSGRSVEAELVRAGFARSDGRGRDRALLAALEAEARAARRGCLWAAGSTR